ARAARLVGWPVEQANIKVVKDTIKAKIDGEDYERTVDRALDVRGPLTWRLSPNGGFPTVAVPAGYTKEVYDRAVVRGADGSKQPGGPVGPQPLAVPGSDAFPVPPFS